MKTLADASLRLHHEVEVTQIGEVGIEFHDRRTGLRFAIDDLPRFDPEQEPPAAVVEFLRQVGCLSEALTPSEVQYRQFRFRDEQAWNERLERLRDSLSFATRHVPFYREAADRYDPGGIVDRSSLLQLPMLQKRDLRENFLRLCADNIDYATEISQGRLELVSTSGTTEERLQAFSDASIVRIPADHAAFWGHACVLGTPRTAVLTSASCLAGRCTLSPNDLASRVVHEHTLYCLLCGMPSQSVGKK